MTEQEDIPVDFERLDAQQRYLAWLRRMKFYRLKRHHKKVFPKGHPFHVAMPKWAPRYYHERRCYFYYCAVNYHLPEPFATSFKKRAKAILTQRLTDDTKSIDMQILNVIHELRKFTKDGILGLPEARVDAYLHSLGYILSVPFEQKRLVLLELYYFRTTDITRRYKNTVRLHVYRLDQPTLRARILENPKLRFHEFSVRFKDEFPHLKIRSFETSRSYLRKVGYKLPRLCNRIINPLRVTTDGKKTALGKELLKAAHRRRQQREVSMALQKTQDIKKRIESR